MPYSTGLHLEQVRESPFARRVIFFVIEVFGSLHRRHQGLALLKGLEPEWFGNTSSYAVPSASNWQ